MLLPQNPAIQACRLHDPSKQGVLTEPRCLQVPGVEGVRFRVQDQGSYAFGFLASVRAAHVHSWRATSRKATRSAAWTSPDRRTTPSVGLASALLNLAVKPATTRSTSCAQQLGDGECSSTA